RAVVAGLLGLVLVPWGSLGPGTLVAAQLGGEDVTELGYRSAVLSLPVLVVSMVTVLVVLRRRPTPRLVAAAVAVVVVQWAPLVAAHLAVGPPPAGVVASERCSSSCWPSCGSAPVACPRSRHHCCGRWCPTSLCSRGSWGRPSSWGSSVIRGGSPGSRTRRCGSTSPRSSRSSPPAVVRRSGRCSGAH